MSPKKSKKVIHRAGVIPYFVTSEGEILMMFMKPSDKEFGGNCFQIAKGKYEKEDTARSAAFREAHEELGLKMSNVAFVLELGVFLGYTTLFLPKIIDMNDFDETCFETSETKWMTCSEFQEVGRTLHRPIVREADAFIFSEEDV